MAIFKKCPFCQSSDSYNLYNMRRRPTEVLNELVRFSENVKMSKSKVLEFANSFQCEVDEIFEMHPEAQKNIKLKAEYTKLIIQKNLEIEKLEDNLKELNKRFLERGDWIDTLKRLQRIYEVKFDNLMEEYNKIKKPQKMD